MSLGKVMEKFSTVANASGSRDLNTSCLLSRKYFMAPLRLSKLISARASLFISCPLQSNTNELKTE